jgi:hypothetical protein
LRSEPVRAEDSDGEQDLPSKIWYTKDVAHTPEQGKPRLSVGVLVAARRRTWTFEGRRQDLNSTPCS